MRRFLSVLLAVLALAGAWAAVGSTSSKRTADRLRASATRHRDAAWHWQQLVGVRPTPARRAPGSAVARVRFWRREAARAWKLALRPPHLPQWLCIHRYEGSWTARTGNGYYGGLQMDLAFQRAYGSRLLRLKGTADRWTPLEQMWVAERAHRSGRGFGPWPNTARYCGLL